MNIFKDKLNKNDKLEKFIENKDYKKNKILVLIYLKK